MAAAQRLPIIQELIDRVGPLPHDTAHPELWTDLPPTVVKLDTSKLPTTVQRDLTTNIDNALQRWYDTY